MVLFPAWDPSLLVPTQLIPESLALALTSALKTSLGVCTPPLVEGEAMSILIGSLVLGSLNTKLLPGGEHDAQPLVVWSGHDDVRVARGGERRPAGTRECEQCRASRDGPQHARVSYRSRSGHDVFLSSRQRSVVAALYVNGQHQCRFLSSS